MNTTIIGVIALLTFAWTILVQKIDPSADDLYKVGVADRQPFEGEQKILGATFKQEQYTGYWYEKEGRLEIFYGGQLVKTLYLVDEGRAEFYFRRWIHANE